MKDKVISAIFIIALAITVVVATAKADTQETVACEPTTEPTTAETTEYITEPTETEMPTEATEEAVTLYDVPLDVSLQEHIIEQAESHGIDPAIIVAMAYKESTYTHDAIGDGGDSVGLLQIQEKWHRERMERLDCTNLLDPYQNVTVGVDYLAELLNRYGSIDKALTAYNRGSYNGTVTNYAKTVMAVAEGLVAR